MKDIEHQRGGRGKIDGISEHEIVRSPISKPRLKQGIEEKVGDRYNVSKTIVKQGLDGDLRYCANMPETMGIQTLKKGWLPVHINGIHLISERASHKGCCMRKRSSRIVVPHYRQVNVGVIKIHQCYQQIIR